MCGHTSHYSGCLSGYVWSHFSLLWVFERVCVVTLLTTVAVCQGMCGHTSHYSGCLSGYVWSHFSLLWVFERVLVCGLCTDCLFTTSVVYPVISRSLCPVHSNSHLTGPAPVTGHLCESNHVHGSPSQLP